MRVHNQQTSRGLGVTRRRERISVCRVPIVHLDDAGELACRWTWLIMLMEKDDERTGTALAVARRGGRREVEHQRALAGRGGRPHRLAGAMVCVVSSQQSDCFGRADSGGGGQTVPWNSIHGLRAVKPAAWVSAFKSRELPALSIRCVVVCTVGFPVSFRSTLSEVRLLTRGPPREESSGPFSAHYSTFLR